MKFAVPETFPPHILIPKAPDDPDPQTLAEFRRRFETERSLQRPTLHPDYLKALNLDEEVGRRCVEAVTSTLAHLLENGERVEIQTFGIFALHSFRVKSNRLGRCGKAVEAPPMSPIHFEPCALLLRQIELGERKEHSLPRCDILFTALREHTDLPRAGIPQIILGTFLALSDHLIRRRGIRLEGLGQILIRRSGYSFRIDPLKGGPVGIRPRYTLRFRIDPQLAHRLRGSHTGRILPSRGGRVPRAGGRK